MEIQTALIQGLTQLFADQRHPLQSAQAATVEDSVPGPLISQSQQSTREVVADLGEAMRSGERMAVLSSGEKQILTMFFDGLTEADSTLYGVEPPKPAVLGNFVDIRG